MRDHRALVIFLVFSVLYLCLAWVVSGGETWWVLDFVDGQNIFFGDDAYRFFLSRGAWINADLYTYNFVLPGQLFIDGAITFLFDGSLYLSRSAHALVGAAGLSLLYLCGRRLGVSSVVMFAAIVIMGLLPRYALMCLSFYGEVWLGFFIVLALFFFLRGNFLLVSLAASWFPLLRPEGIFFLIPLCIFFMKNRRSVELVLLLLPGVVYFLFLYFSLPSLGDYSNWRAELRTILSKLDPQYGARDILVLYSVMFTVPAGIALMAPQARRIWPFLAGGLLWIVFFQVLVLMERATFENRYTYVLVPLVTLLWAAFFQWLSAFLQNFFPARRLAGLGKGAAMVVAIAIVLVHLHKTTNVQQALRNHGYGGTLERVWEGRWDEIYGYHPEASIKAREELAGIVEELLVMDSGIDNVSIYSNSLFYHLDPYKVPPHVTVGFLTNGYMVFHLLLEGQSFIQHAGGNMYSYLDYGEPDFSEGEKRAIIVTIMPLKNYPYTWKRDSIEMYLFSYLESDSARVDVSNKPVLTPKMLDDAYAPWYGK